VINVLGKLEYESPRAALGEIYVHAGRDYPQLVMVDCDLSPATRSFRFEEEYPDRFFQFGIGEQNAMSAITGMAIEGLIPLYANFTFFISGTGWTQLRQNCLAEVNIKLVGTHPGMDNGPDGGSHHSNEDIALSRTIPNLTVLSPTDSFEVEAAVSGALKANGPVYIRVPRDTTPTLHEQVGEFPVGKAEILAREGSDFAVVFEGGAALQAVEGYRRLTEAGRKGILVSVRSLKPFDETAILDIADTVKTMVTVENHSILGGLGGLVAETLSSTHSRCVHTMVGVPDVFTESGVARDVKAKFGLSASAVVAAVNG
jgi:transketolase